MRRFSFIFVLLCLLAACSTPPEVEEPMPEPDPSLAACPDTIVIENFAFSPAACRVTPGTTVTFLNRDLMIHTATSSLRAAAPFDTGTLERGQTAEVTFTESGDYPYYCSTHEDMKASITVD